MRRKRVGNVFEKGYVDSVLDIGNARIAGLEASLHLTGTQYRQLLWAFHIPYILFEWMTLL